MQVALSLLQFLFAPLVLLCIVLVLWVYRDRFFAHDKASSTASTAMSDASNAERTILEISVQARKNLGLVSLPAMPQDYWRSALIPGVIEDRPGVSDRGVTSPAVGVVTAIHAHPGHTIRLGESLFTLRLFSENLQATQTQLFKASQEITILQTELDRLSDAVASGAVAQSKVISLCGDVCRQTTLIQAARQDDNPVNDQRHVQQAHLVNGELNLDRASTSELAYELQELSVELGQQVQAGQSGQALQSPIALCDRTRVQGRGKLS
jgi:hypothetical protein